MEKMESPSLSTLTSLSAIQKAALSRGMLTVYHIESILSDTQYVANIKTVADLLLLSHYDLSKRCRITPTDAQNIVDRVCEELYKAPLSLDDPSVRRDEVFSTGNENLDNALGGGIRTGMLWEVVGERCSLPFAPSSSH